MLGDTETLVLFLIGAAPTFSASRDRAPDLVLVLPVFSPLVASSPAPAPGTVAGAFVCA